MSMPDHIVEASISTLATSLSTGVLTSVDLVAKCLLRISTYDCRNTLLNAIPLLNENIFSEAQASDDRRKDDRARGPLDGIPFTVKDSYKVKGMTVASGSEAFETLVANEDAFMVDALRQAGAVLLGRTNMCPMAYGGMLRGVYGRAENPYNPEYLAAAFGSGSSNGSGVSTAASFASFGLGGETVSSGRSPASNNALVVYTPSKGVISLRGSWPLYPTCDVLIPHTRTVDDLLALLDVLTTEDPETTGDFWRDQPFVQLPKAWSVPPSPFYTIKDDNYLKGKHIAVPKMYIQQCENGPFVSQSVASLFIQAKQDLEAAGATVTIIDTFPAIQQYDKAITSTSLDQNPTTNPPLPPNWNTTERGPLIANGWEDFLQSISSLTHPSLTTINPEFMFPHLPRTNPQVKFTEPANAVHWPRLAEYISSRPATSTTYTGKSPIYDVANLKQACLALESLRKTYFDGWLTDNNYDFVAFPAAGDVAKATADIDDDDAKHAWTDGVKYSHGNRALRHLGIPSVTVPMGMLEGKGVPMGLTFLGRAYDDLEILRVAGAFESKTKRRVTPTYTPVLESDYIAPMEKDAERKVRPVLEVVQCAAKASEDGSTRDGMTTVQIEGTITGAVSLILDMYIDAVRVENRDIQISATSSISSDAQATSRFSCTVTVPSPPVHDERNKVVGKIARDSTMVMILARDGKAGYPAGYLKLIHRSDQ